MTAGRLISHILSSSHRPGWSPGCTTPTWHHQIVGLNFDLTGNQMKLSEVNPGHKPFPFSHSHIHSFIVSSGKCY